MTVWVCQWLVSVQVVSSLPRRGAAGVGHTYRCG